MVQINLPDQVGNLLTNLMPNWKASDDKIAKSATLVNDRALVLAHHTTKNKHESAHFHNLILKDAFNLTITTGANPFLKRITMENIFFHLSSALDALAHEINGVYGFNIDYNRIQIDYQANPKICLRT